MKVARCYRWDLVVGGAAAVIAIAGLGLSVALGNTETIAAGTIASETQRALLVLAGVFLLLVLIKAGIRYRGVLSTACPGSLERWWLRRQRRD
jgi:hypothetical protein